MRYTGGSVRTPGERKSLVDRENQTSTNTHGHVVADLKSAQCRFESDWGHVVRPGCLGVVSVAQGPFL